jgi:RNA polymerase sigma factor (sigma-70 family)
MRNTNSSVGESVESDWIRSVVERYSGPLTRYAWFIAQDLERARDIVQDTFIRLCAGDRHQIEPHLAEWLFTVCRHRALDVMRKESRMQPLDDLELNHPVCPAPGPAVQAERQESLDRIWEILASLPRQQQEVLRLKFQNDLRYEEISRITRLSVSNVGFIIHTAIKNIRLKLHTLENPAVHPARRSL